MKKSNGVVIYKNLLEIIDPEHTCLVVWDVQHGLVDRIFNKDAFIAALPSFIESVRSRMPVFYTMITPLARNFASSWSLYAMMRRFQVADVSKLPAFMAPGSRERQIPEAVAPKKGDIVLEKAFASIFVGTNFEAMLRNRAITTIIFTGISTEIGIESSARDAANHGFYPVVIADLVSSPDKEAHERSLKNMEKLFIVADADTILKALVQT
jgi:nicotinamidase-related amidase